MAIGDDFTVSLGGDIRHASGTTVYSVLALHQWLQDMADDASVSTSGDNVSILTANPSKLDGPRSAIKPMLLNLLNGYNIDDTAAQFLNFGSIQQNGTNELYTGVKTIGSPLVAASPMYIVQNGSKLTSYWPNGHIQIIVKGKTGGALIDNGDIRVFSRKYGQTYGDFAANLVAGGEQPAAISTATTSDWTPLSLAAAQALSSKVTITVGDQSYDTGDGNGSKLYKGTITLSNGCTIAEAAQYCQAICDQASTTTINSELGWKYRVLNAAYTPNAAAPFGTVAGGKWFVAQGWYIAGALTADGQKYQMISHDGTTVTNPIVAGITIGGLTVGARVLVGRDSGTGDAYTLAGATTAVGNTCVVNEVVPTKTPATGTIEIGGNTYPYTAVNAGTKTFTISGTWGQIYAISAATHVNANTFLTNEYTLNGATTSGGNTCVVNEAIKADTPATGYLRVNGIPYLYTGYVAGTKTFTISGTWGQIHASASLAWVPFIDKVAASVSESSASYVYSSTFTARLKVRLGTGGTPLQPFETTFSAAASTSNGTNAIATADV